MPVLIEEHGENGPFSNVKPNQGNCIKGFFGVCGFYLCCVANCDAARAEILFNRESRQENKDAFDSLFAHKSEIEAALGTSLQWNRGDNIRQSKVFIQLSHVSIGKETDWLQMANFHAKWTKRFYDVVVPYIRQANEIL